MTLIVESPFRSNLTGVESAHVGLGDGGLHREGTTKVGGGRPSFNADGCEVLLEELAIGLWATEAGARYGVTAIDALELLAYALFLDGEV